MTPSPPDPHRGPSRRTRLWISLAGPFVVAGLIAMLASEDGAHINGEEIRVDGGTLS